VDELRPWALLAALGAFHGINPAMGWLFAVALGLQRRSRAAVVWSLLPIALGHALSIGVVLVIFVVLRVMLDVKYLQIAAALFLFAMAAYRLIGRHVGRGGMQVGFGDLLAWSFAMATGHGAGVMLIPVLLRMPLGVAHAEHLHSAWPPGVAHSLLGGVAIVVGHTVAMLAVAGAIALIVYEWAGLAFLRWGWVNFDRLWSAALVAAGVVVAAPVFL
jgi:hypothetical protein